MFSDGYLRGKSHALRKMSGGSHPPSQRIRDRCGGEAAQHCQCQASDAIVAQLMNILEADMFAHDAEWLGHWVRLDLLFGE